MILKNAMEITFARVELTSSELEISFPIHRVKLRMLVSGAYLYKKTNNICDNYILLYIDNQRLLGDYNLNYSYKKQRIITKSYNLSIYFAR